MIISEICESDARLLQRAGSLLDTVGRHADGAVPGAIDCLTAVEYLTQLGLDVSPPSLRVSRENAATAIGEALQLVAKLSTPTFVLSEVVAATDCAQRAFTACSRG